ncbi:hypothetical protein GXM_08519 [Nostoc sphaeroides CCNUC1]|uniref:Uncharacterized protein n=1 Tax=Nostoc sphaeroides CCNUC1 TaxID=2653204 RepID=A0A5P8WDZ4_9NOSO|nr:hypothetical protein GXM_08519 [Nostoc sphaeroides CCNUC1]
MPTQTPISPQIGLKSPVRFLNNPLLYKSILWGCGVWFYCSIRPHTALKKSLLWG